MHSAWYLYLYS